MRNKTNRETMTVRDLGNIAAAAGVLPSELIEICESRRAASKPGE